MKHLLATLIITCFSFTAVIAQDSSMSKEEAKALKEANMKEAFSSAGFTPAEEELVRTSYANRSANNKKLKADTSLSPEDIKAKAKEFSTSEDNMLKEKIGLQKYKAFKDTQKKQREMAARSEKEAANLEKSTEKEIDKALAKAERDAEREAKRVEREAAKAARLAAKTQKDNDFKAICREAGLNSYEEDLIRTSYANRSTNKKLLKNDPTLTEDDIAVKSKAYSKAEDDLLIERMGKTKYRAFKDAQKAQRAAALKAAEAAANK